LLVDLRSEFSDFCSGICIRKGYPVSSEVTRI
jgi:hypothetical protein